MSLSNRLGLLGRKVGMMRIFTDDGDAVPVTVLDVSNNRVTQVKTEATDGYNALQVAFGSRKASRITKPEADKQPQTFTVPGADVLTLTTMLELLVAPASNWLIEPVPLIKLAPVPVAVPNAAPRSSTKPVGPVAMFEMLKVWLTLWPTCTVPKFKLVVLTWPMAA